MEFVHYVLHHFAKKETRDGGLVVKDGRGEGVVGHFLQPHFFTTKLLCMNFLLQGVTFASFRCVQFVSSAKAL